MANVDKRMGFQPITSAGVETRRQQRSVDVENTNLIAPGDAYTIEADGYVTRQTSTSVACNGIMEAVALPGAAIQEGPMTYDYVPALTALNIIGIEDSNCEFAVVTDGTITRDDYDSAAQVDIVDTAPNVPLRQSRQAVGDAGGDQFKLVRPVDSPDNDQYAQYARVVVRLLPASVQ